MNSLWISAGILVILAVIMAGCTGPGYVPSQNNQTQGGGTGLMKPAASPTGTGPADQFTSKHPTITDQGIPLLLTGTDWQLAEGCGWTEKDIQETVALFTSNCEVNNLLADGWKIEGIGYDMNFLGSRCRMSTHPDTTESCDWCLDAGPTLVMQRDGLTTEFLANMKNQTVTRFRTTIPDDAASISTGDSDIVTLRNGTVLYTFRKC